MHSRSFTWSSLHLKFSFNKLGHAAVLRGHPLSCQAQVASGRAVFFELGSHFAFEISVGLGEEVEFGFAGSAEAILRFGGKISLPDFQSKGILGFFEGGDLHFHLFYFIRLSLSSIISLF